MIECQKPEMDNYICMSYRDFDSFYKTYVLGCKVWYPSKKMTLSEMIEKQKLVESLTRER